MKLCSRNWACQIGELDLVMIDGRELVFIEVKARRDCPVARKHIFDNISAKKRRKLRVLVEIFLKRHFGNGSYPDHRIDVVGVFLTPDGEGVVSIEHIVGAV